MNASPHKTVFEPASPAQPVAGRRTVATPAFKLEAVRSVRMHPVLAAAVAAVVFVGIVGFALHLKPVWLAETQVYVEPAAAKLIGDQGAGMFDYNHYESLLQQQMQIATRPDILEEAIATLPAGTWRMPGEPLPAAAGRLASALNVKRVTTSYQLAIDLKMDDPVKAAATVNAVTTSYLKAARKEELAQSDQRARLLAEERQRTETELAQARTEQAALSGSLGVAGASSVEANPYDAQLVGLRTELAAAREAHDAAAAQLTAYSGNGIHAAGLTAAADEAIASDAGLSSMKSTISSRRAQLEGQMAGLTPSNPIYKQDQDEIADLDKSLEKTVQQTRANAARRLEDKLQAELNRTADVEARLNTQLARQTQTATSATPRLQRAAELTADIQRLMARYATVDDSLRALELDVNGPGLVRLVLPAAVPGAPEPDRKRLLLLAALPLALLFGLLAAVLARKRDSRLYIGRDLDDVLGFSPVAVLPARADVSAAVWQECVLRLAGGVEGAYRAGSARTFVFTSVSPGTETGALLAALESRLRGLGLAVSAVSAPTLLEPVRETPGHAPEREGVRHEGYVALNLERARAEADLVFVDAPPLLVSASTEYVARVADTVILIVESGVTTRGQLMQAGTLLQQLNVGGIGMVLEGLNLCAAEPGYKASIEELERRLDTLPVPPPLQPEPGPSSPSRALPYADEPHAGERVGALPGLTHYAAASAAQPAYMTAKREEVVTDPLPDPLPKLVAQAEPSESFETSPVAPPVLPVAERVPVQLPQALSSADAVFSPDEADALPVLVPASHASTPHSSVETVMPETKNWFQRLFQRDAAPVVSIIPDDDNESDTNSYEAAAPEPVMAHAYRDEATAAPAVVTTERSFPVSDIAAAPLEQDCQAAQVEEENDFDWVNGLVPTAAVALPVPVATPQAASVAPAPPVRFEPRVEAAIQPVRPLSFLELTQMASGSETMAPEAPECATTNELTESAPEAVVDPAHFVLAVPTPALPVPAESISDEPLAAAETAVVPAPIPEPPAAGQMLHAGGLARLAAELPELRPAVPRPLAAGTAAGPGPVERPTPAPRIEQTPYDREAERGLTTGRWESMPALRPAPAPRRDRPSLAARPAARVDSAPVEPSYPRESLYRVASGAVAPAVPLHAPESSPTGLTRRWGLLSRFEPQPTDDANPPALTGTRR